MRVYLAGPWKERVTSVHNARKMLQLAGFTVDCRWIDFDSTANDENSDEVMRREAEIDIYDVTVSDALLVFNPNGIVSEGKAFEQGLAYGSGKPIVVVGPYTCVFQRLREVVRVDTLAEAIVALSAIESVTS